MSTQIKSVSKEAILWISDIHMLDDTETLAGTTHAIQQYLLLVDTSEVTDGAANYAYELIVLVFD